MKTTENAVENMLAHIVSECRAIDTDSRYDEMLDECFSFKSVGGIFANMSPARVLREVDPVAYRCGKNDWLDGELGETMVEINDEHYDKSEVDEAQAEFIANLEAEVSEMERVIEELEAEEEELEAEEFVDNSAKILGLSARLDTMRATVTACETHSL
jgi:predicted ribosome quality control (RQC) complex YloA/Tae2 family protein